MHTIRVDDWSQALDESTIDREWGEIAHRGRSLISTIAFICLILQEVVSRRSSTRCRRRQSYRRSPRRAARARRPSAAADGRHPRRRRRGEAAPWTTSSGAAAPTTWRSAPSFRRRSATRGGQRPNDGAFATSVLRPTCITTTPDVRWVTVVQPVAYNREVQTVRMVYRMSQPSGPELQDLHFHY